MKKKKKKKMWNMRAIEMPIAVSPFGKVCKGLGEKKEESRPYKLKDLDQWEYWEKSGRLEETSSL